MATLKRIRHEKNRDAERFRSAFFARGNQPLTFLLNLERNFAKCKRFIYSFFQQQQLIELIRDGRVEEALKFASEQLAERGEEEPQVLEELERTLALLAFEDPSQSPFSDLLSHSHRQKVSWNFRLF